jgi:hypothetical protein
MKLKRHGYNFFWWAKFHEAKSSRRNWELFSKLRNFLPVMEQKPLATYIKTQYQAHEWTQYHHNLFYKDPIQYYTSIYLQVSLSSYANYSVIRTYAPVHATSCINMIPDYFSTLITSCKQCSPIHGDKNNHRRQREKSLKMKMTFWQQTFVCFQIINFMIHAICTITFNHSINV